MISGKSLADGDQVVSLTSCIFFSMSLLLHLTNSYHSRGFSLKVKVLVAFDPLQCSFDEMLLKVVTPIIGGYITCSI